MCFLLLLAPTVFSLPQRKKDFVALIKNLSSIFLESPDETVLSNIAHSMSYLSKGDHARVNDVKNVLKKMAEVLKKRVLDLVADGDTDDITEENVTPNRKRKTRKKEDNSSKKRKISLDSSQDSKEDSEYVLMINLKRLRILSKSYDILSPLGGDDGVEHFTFELTRKLSQQLTSRKANKLVFEDNQKVHGLVAQSIYEGLNLLLVLTAWRLRLLQDEEKVLILEEDLSTEMKDDDEVTEIESHVTLTLRDRMIGLIEACFEHFLVFDETDEEKSLNFFPKAMIEFSHSVQITAGKISSDLRILFPKAWKNASNPYLRSLALVEDGRLIGGFVRYFRSQEGMVSLIFEKYKISFNFLILLSCPLCRSFE